jgi:hypothetical protein
MRHHVLLTNGWLLEVTPLFGTTDPLEDARADREPIRSEGQDVFQSAHAGVRVHKATAPSGAVMDIGDVIVLRGEAIASWEFDQPE